MFQIVSKLRLLKDLLKELNRNMGNVFEEVARARSQLEDFREDRSSVGTHLVALQEDSESRLPPCLKDGMRIPSTKGED
ncbi:hypothetical protein Nepgr_026642 [Nepenthes gracilis]|uniref:Uncharacterized protein n=1 Tax=Nepenthes gracilis TaxID=150966 RepID=A0AAD3T9C6_NEPGR|nr:hypothetical protein Nepgr_026642 [Nepenthes gracilis]